MNLIGNRLSENALTASLVSGRTRLVRSRAMPPVRFVHPDSGTRSAVAVSSALGGGMLEGDDYRFSVECGPNATLLFAPQANTRVLPCPDGATTRQAIRGTVYADGLAVCGGDPVVPYAGARFRQCQHWILHPGGRLVIIDWMVAGRLDRGERFAFGEYESSTRVEDPGGNPLLVEGVRLEPEARDPDGAMAGHAALLAVHGMGPGWEGLRDGLKNCLEERTRGREETPRWMAGGMLAGLSTREDRGFSLRALGRDRAALEPLVARLFGLLSSPDWLGFDFWKRKY